MFNLILMAFVLLLSYLAVQVPIEKYQQKIGDLHGEIQILRESAEPVSNRLEMVTQRQRSIADLIEYKRRTRPTVDLLLELTNLASDATWVNRLERSDDKLKLRGESKQPAVFIERLASSPMFEKVEPSSPLITVPGSLYARFDLSLTLSAGRER